MESILALWLPVLVAAVLVFVVSAVIHMLLGYHNKDWSSLPDEDGFRRAVGPLGVPPGDYMVPRCTSMKEMNSPEFKAKLESGPVMIMTVMPNGEASMGKALMLWFLHCVVVSAFVAWVVGSTMPPNVFALAAVVAFAAYGLADVPTSIWYHRSWATTARNLVDALAYALITGAVFHLL